jgi:hypothetical protein
MFFFERLCSVFMLNQVVSWTWLAPFLLILDSPGLDCVYEYPVILLY